jgi:hypothetical protein
VPTHAWRKPKHSTTAFIAVLAVVLWSISNIVETIMMVHGHHVAVLHRTALTMVAPILTSLVTALAYILVVRKSPSLLRGLWCGLVVVLMVMTAIASLTTPQIGLHAYTNRDTINTVFICLVIAGPLVWFYRRPAKAKVQIPSS